jgi:hypothetical protein
MSGYTPLFDTLTSGTLCGRWPDIGLWAVVLSMSDRHGIVDVTPTYIASVTGLPVDDVAACMERFCQPDKYSRSQEADGARLQLIDPARPWGWQIVNHSKYREKARKASYDSARTASGLDAERKRLSRDVPTPPAPSRSQTETETKTKTEEQDGGSARARSPRPSKRCPADFEVTQELRDWAAEKYPGVNVDAETEAFRDHTFATARSDWPATWRSWFRKGAKFAGTANGAKPERKTRYELMQEALRNAAEP